MHPKSECRTRFVSQETDRVQLAIARQPLDVRDDRAHGFGRVALDNQCRVGERPPTLGTLLQKNVNL